ncbi:MAG: mechanosensitive ion channel [Pseudodesulfovibrio sp.]|nr:mechanosensitive ion channel [Pseudodesulfovibrio sp.]
MDRKHFEATLAYLSNKNSNLVEDLKSVADTVSIRIDLFQSYEQLASNTKDTTSSLYSEYNHVWEKAQGIQAKSHKQLAQLESLLRKTDQLLGRIEKIQHGKNSLYELWRQYFIAGKTPVFSLEYWKGVLPSRNWVALKYSELENAAATITSNFVKYFFLSITLMGMGIVTKRFFQNRISTKANKEKSAIRSRFYFVLATTSLSLFLATRITFPTGMESMAALAAGLFLLSILKLSKHISNDSHLSSYGYSRFAFLFIVSTQLLTLGLPNRSITLLFLILTLTLWGKDFIFAWHKKGQPMTFTAMRGGALTPLFALAVFGYGRLACLFTIIWCMGVFVVALGTLWSHILFHGTEKSTKTQKGLSKGLLVPLGWTGAFTLPYLWLVDFFGDDTVSTILNYKITIGDYSLFLKNFVTLFILFFLTKHSIVAFNVSIDFVGSRWQKAKRGAIPSIQTLTTYAVWSLYSILAMRIIGVSLTSITVIAGGLSVGIGFGLQNVVNNFISGLILLFGRSIQQGDIIEMNSVWCTVKKINIRTTVVETFESAVIMIPNSDLVSTQLTNWTKNNPSLRRDILIGVAYGSDTEKVRQTLSRIADEHPHVLKSPPAYVHFNDFGSSSLDFILRIWIDDIDHTIRATSELRFAIDAAFRREGIEIAFPQMDIHFKTAPALADHLAKME